MKICVAGQGAFGQKHLDALKRIPDVEVTSLVGGNQDATAEVAKKYGIPHYTGDLAEGIKRADAVILTTPTKMHFRQGEQVMRAGKHVLVEIPITDSVEDAEALVKIAKETGVIAMAGHVRRFNPSHQYIHKKIEKGELKIQQMDVQTYFFRRKNMNAAGQPRSWTDHLLWHHAAHTVDLFQYQAGETISDCYAVQGPIHPQLGIAMDMGIVAKVPSGSILTLSLSFNNDGPIGSFFRYICDNGTYKAYYDDLSTARTTRSICPKSTFPWTASSSRIASSSPRSRKSASRTGAWPRSCPACTCSASSKASSTRSARRTLNSGRRVFLLSSFSLFVVGGREQGRPHGCLLSVAAANFVDQPNHTTGPARPADAGQKVVNLALQGGGSHGAFTWGVLDRLLEEERLSFEGITGTSAGAVNAVVLADGLAEGGREGARDALRRYWKKVSALSARGPLAPSAIDKANPDFGLEHSLGFIFLEPMTYFASPYQMNPFNYNPFKDLLAEAIDFERVRRQTAVKLFLCATNVETAKVKVFPGKDIGVQHLLASTCLPLLMQAVEIDGEYFWDGSYAGNPAIFPLVYDCDDARHPHGAHHAGRAAGSPDHLARDHEIACRRSASIPH